MQLFLQRMYSRLSPSVAAPIFVSLAAEIHWGSFLVQNFKRKLSTLSRVHDDLKRALNMLNSGAELIL